MPLFSTVIRIRFGDVDHARILYYPRFFHLFHLAFEDFFNDGLKLPYREAIEADQVGFPAVHAEADYLNQVRFGDRVAISVEIHRIGEKSVTFRYVVTLADDGTLCARGEVTVVTVDMATLEGVPIPAKYRQLFEQYRSQSQG